MHGHPCGYTLDAVNDSPTNQDSNPATTPPQVGQAVAVSPGGTGEPAAKAGRQREWVDYTYEMTITKYRALRVVYRAIGFGAIVMGVLGYLLPGLPGTVFFLIAAYFFSQSSPRFYNWLMNHRIFGSMIRDYRAGKGIPRWVKVYAPIMIVTFSGWSAYRLGVVLEKPWIGFSIVVIAAYGVWYVLRVPTSDSDRSDK